MASVSVCAAGVDIGRDYLDVAVLPQGRSFRAPNAPAGIAVVVDRLRRMGATRVALESIGAYAQRLVRALAEAGFQVGVVDPRRIAALRLAEGGRAKTDRLDAKLIARFAVLMSEACRPVPSAETLYLRALSTRRRQLVEMIAMEKTRLKQTIDAGIAENHRAAIAQLSVLRTAVESEIAERTQAIEHGGEKIALLQSIPGIGPAIAATLVVDMPELGSLGSKQVASLAGLAPHANESGLKNGVRAISGGRSCVRAALYMAALSAARSERGYRREYENMRTAGKPAKVALIAIARKLAVIANAVVKSKQPWAGNHH